MTHCRPPAPAWTDADERQLQGQIADDPHALEATDEQLANARPFSQAFPELAAMIRRTRRDPQ